MIKILITGSAGFIGYHLSKKLLEDVNCEVIGVDNINDYYDPQLKIERNNILLSFKNYSFFKIDIANKCDLEKIFYQFKIDIVINLAAQAGVRYSFDHPDQYITSNIIGFYNVLEACKKYNIKNLIFASSSSVYGANDKTPYSVEDKTDNPVSLYAATKKCDELLAYSYAKCYGIKCTGLRFFTVYGPFGRPDMAYYSFTKNAIEGKKIKLFNYGDLYRDFTYIDDIVNGIVLVINSTPKSDNHGVYYKIYNIGNNNPVSLLKFVNTIENKLQKYNLITGSIKTELVQMQPGDVYQTYADVNDLLNDFNWKPTTSLEQGLDKFISWYANYKVR